MCCSLQPILQILKVFFLLCISQMFKLKLVPASSADWDAHFVVASEAVELIELIRCVAGPGPHLSS
jgi:hypothetical protein